MMMMTEVLLLRIKGGTEMYRSSVRLIDIITLCKQSEKGCVAKEASTYTS
jgi:hypothetical protein